MYRAFPRPVRVALNPARVASGALVVTALCVGLGDIARVTPLNMVLLGSVRDLPLVAIAAGLVRALRDRRAPALPPQVAWPAATWLAVLAASALLAPTHQADAIAAIERPATGALIAWTVCDLAARGGHCLSLMRTLALGGLAVALVGLAEASGAPPVLDGLATLQSGSVPIGDVPRVSATLSHPNEASMLLELTAPLLLAWLWTTARPWQPVLLVSTLGTLIALVLTFSRAGIAAVLLSLAMMAVVCAVRSAWQRLAVVGLASLVIPLTLGWAALMDPGLDRRLSAGVDESSLDQPARPEFWHVALHMWRDHPWLGVGPDNFRWQFADYSGVAADNLGIHAHDQYLETLADTGLLGLGSFLWLAFSVLRVGAGRLRTAYGDWPWYLALLGSLTAWFAHALLDDFERFWPTSVAFWLILGLVLAPGRRSSAVEQPVHAADDRDDNQQHQDACGAAQRRGAATTAAETHHSGAIVAGRR